MYVFQFCCSCHLLPAAILACGAVCQVRPAGCPSVSGLSPGCAQLTNCWCPVTWWHPDICSLATQEAAVIFNRIVRISGRNRLAHCWSGKCTAQSWSRKSMWSSASVHCLWSCVTRSLCMQDEHQLDYGSSAELTLPAYLTITYGTTLALLARL